jgi:hypothetical protein
MSAVTPIADKMLQCRECPLCAISDHLHCSKEHRYSIIRQFEKEHEAQ